jgi:WD40 repeat protein
MKRLTPAIAALILPLFGNVRTATATSYQFNEQFCRSSYQTCEAIVNTAGLIEPTYEANNVVQATSFLQEVQWYDGGVRWEDAQISFVNRGEASGINLDVQAILAKQQIESKTIYLISIRGTESLVDWVNNFRFGLTEFPYGSGRVHRGFFEYANSVFESATAKSFFQEIRDQQRRGEAYEVWVTGHSLGGATAIVFSAILQAEFNLPNANLRTITFGAPSPGNEEFVTEYAENTIRAEIVGDPATSATSLALPQLAGGTYQQNFGRIIRVIPSPSRVQQLKELRNRLVSGDDRLDVLKEIIQISVEIHKLEYGERFEGMNLAAATSPESPNQPPEPYIPPNFQRLHTMEVPTTGVNAIAILPVQNLAVTGGTDNNLYVWDMETGERIATQPAHNDDITAIAYHRQGNLLASASQDGTVKVWQLQNNQLSLRQTLSGHAGWVTAVAISPDGRRIISGSSDKTIKIWDATTGGLQQTLTGHKSAVYDLAIAPENTLVSASQDRSIKLWNLTTGELQETLTDHQAGVYSLAVAPKEQTLVSGSADKTIKLWHLSTGDLIATFTGHDSIVNSLEMTSDGKALLSASSDGTVKMWRLATGEVLRTLQNGKQAIRSLALSENGDFLITGTRGSKLAADSNGELLLWDGRSNANMRSRQ